jgi:peptide/nickel transport system substrate-binding protein
MRRLTKLGVVLALSLLAAACSSSPGGGGGGGGNHASGTLTIDNESGATWTCGFNPFISGGSSGVNFSLGLVYEPLVFVNVLQDQHTVPVLASKFAWSNGDKTLTFTIRSGVKFSDGTPLTAADVVYTFNLLKNTVVNGTKVLDLNAVWSVLTGVTQQGSNQVVMQFNGPALSYFYYVADQVGIVPQKIWSKISNPAKYNDANPVGSGPYTMSSCTPQNIAYKANPHYWQAGLPKIETVNYPSFLSNDTANTYLAAGSAQWGSQFIPSIQAFYLSKSPNYHTWSPPVANVTLFPNLKNPLLANVAVRQAISYAINKSQASKLGEYGEEPPSNQTGIVSPTFSTWQDSTLAAQYGNGYSYNPAKAISILKAAGFTKGPDGIFAKNGQKLSFTILNNGGFSDWVNAVAVVVQDLKAVGIQATPRDLSGTTYNNDLLTGQFQLAYGSESGGPAPYYELRQWLYSKNSAPIGTAAASNFERFNSPAVDALINSYPNALSPAAQHQIINKLQQIMLSQVPVIPVTESVDWFQYVTGPSGYSGWPTPSNPYAQPAAYNVPDWEQVLLHLSPGH